MKLEDRLRAELDRSGQTTNVGAAPSIDDLAAVADGRQRRNRMVGAGGAAVLSVSVLLGAFVMSQDSGSTVEVASDRSADVASPDAEENLQQDGSETAQGSESAATGGGDDTTVDQGENLDDAGVRVFETTETTSDDEVEPAAALVDDEPAEAVVVVAPPVAVGAALQPDDAVMTVEKRDSAVGLASGSGVLIVPGGDGYLGLGVAFGNETTALSLASSNGLDWISAVPEGIPVGATASVLREYSGGYVALFERFNPTAGLKEFFVGTSTDTVVWDVSEPLPGGEVYATDLAVGDPGVIIIGDDTSPQVWSGPVGGPYELTGELDASMVNGVTTVDGEFVVAGRSVESGVLVFTSPDAKEWSATALSSDAGANLSLSANDGTLTMRTIDDTTADTLISSDAGKTWSALPVSTSSMVSASTTTMGFLGEEGGDAVVAVADDATFSTVDLDVAAPDRVALVATGSDELVMVQTTEAGTTWIVASR